MRLRASGGVLERRSNRDVCGRIDRLIRVGKLTAVLPGVYCAPESCRDPAILVRAAALWAGPDAVLTGYAAARLTFWPTCPMNEVELALPATRKRSRPGVRVQRRIIPPELVVRRAALAMTCPSLTAVDLADRECGGEGIDRALRSRMATLDQMWEAFRLVPGRRGNAVRVLLLHDSRDRPWSEAERFAHRLLRAGGFTGWDTNRLVGGYWVDILFTAARLIVEIDGWEVHGARQAFEDDRRRRNQLVLAGYTVLNFTWRQLTETRSGSSRACGRRSSADECSLDHRLRWRLSVASALA